MLNLDVMLLSISSKHKGNSINDIQGYDKAHIIPPSQTSSQHSSHILINHHPYNIPHSFLNRLLTIKTRKSQLKMIVPSTHKGQLNGMKDNSRQGN